MVYGILKLLNFAHGDVYMIGAFLGWYALHALGGPVNPTFTGAVVLFLMFVVAMLGCGVLGVAIERFAYRPLRNAPRIAPLISALGVSIFLQNSALLIFGASFRDYNTFDLIGVKTYNIGKLFFSVPQLLTVVAAVGLMIALTVFVARSRLGKAMRSTSFAPEAAAMMGIDVDRVISVTFFIGSALAGAAGVMFALVFGQIYHFIGFIARLKGFTAAGIGGIGGVPPAPGGGLLVGHADACAARHPPPGAAFPKPQLFPLP